MQLYGANLVFRGKKDLRRLVGHRGWNGKQTHFKIFQVKQSKMSLEERQVRIYQAVLFKFLTVFSILSYMHPRGMRLYGYCRFLGCPGPWMLVDRCGRILKGAQVCHTDPLRLMGPLQETSWMEQIIVVRVVTVSRSISDENVSYTHLLDDALMPHRRSLVRSYKGFLLMTCKCYMHGSASDT